MATSTQPGIKHTVQNMANWSFDSDYNVFAIMMLGLNGTTLTRMKVDARGSLIDDYEFAGVQSAGGYLYVGFKKKGAGNWKIMRMNEADNSEVWYAYGTTGYAAAWADSAGQSYALPPDS